MNPILAIISVQSINIGKFNGQIFDVRRGNFRRRTTSIAKHRTKTSTVLASESRDT